MDNLYDDMLTEKQKIAILESSLEKSECFEIDKYNSDFGIEDFLKTNSEGITYLDLFLKKNIFLPSFIEEEMVENMEALLICSKYSKFIFLNISEEMLFSNVNEGKTLIEYMFENNIYFYGLGVIKNRTEVLDLIIKYNKYEELKKLEPELFEKMFINNNGEYLIDKYIDNNNIMQIIVPKLSNSILEKYVNEKNNYKIYKYLKEDNLLKEIAPGQTILDFLYDNDLKPVCYGFDLENLKSLDIMIKHKKYDNLRDVHFTKLLEKNPEGKTYFDILIERFKLGDDIHFEHIEYYKNGKDVDDLADGLIYMAKNDILNYFPDLDEDVLLYRVKYPITEKVNRTVLDSLLEKEPELAMSKILTRYIKTLPSIAVIIKTHGLINNVIDIKSPDKTFSDVLNDEFKNNYAEGYISKCEDKLTELKELFYNDGVSEKEYVDALISSYRYLTAINDNAVLELEQLLEIKKQNPNKFTYKKIPSGAYFNVRDGCICLENASIGTINHETSHALHFYLANNKVPENYEEVINRVRQNPDVLNRLFDYSKKLSEIQKNIFDRIDKKQISDYIDQLYTPDKKNELEKFLTSEKEQKKAEFKERYPEEVLDIILNDMYKVDEFIEQRKELEVFECVDNITRNEYDAFISIGDILDAVFKGLVRNGVSKNEKGENIGKIYGHGIKYYSVPEHGFDEMIADFGGIIKSKNSDEILQLLRYIAGNELVEMISNVYINDIINSKVYLVGEENREVSSNAR